MSKQSIADDAASTTVVLSGRNGFILYLKGIAIGLGDSVPGISGGTIAVVTNIYETFIHSLCSIDSSAFKMLFRGDLLQAWQHINGKFLLILGVGAISGLLISANTVLFFLENYFEPLMAFFIGLVLASTVLLKSEFSFGTWQNLVALFLGITVTISISFIGRTDANLTFFYIFFSGAIAICAMVLPGLSGAFVLILLGVYEFILRALTDFDIAYIAVFVTGCGVGLLSFSRVLSWMLNRYRQLSYAFIVGMLLGSVYLLWPWQKVSQYYTGSDGEQHVLQSSKLLPLNYTEQTGNDALLMVSLLSVIAGFYLVIGLRRLSSRK
jgi:putative membrane protein